MKRLLAAVFSFALINAAVPALSLAAECPPELAQAQAALQKAQQALAKARAPRAGAVAPAPGAIKDRPDEGSPAPRGPKDRPDEGVPVPRGEDTQATRVAKARSLVRQADHACKQGDLALSAQKAKEALALLK